MKLLVLAFALILSVQATAQVRGEVACKVLFTKITREITAEQRTALAQYSELNVGKKLNTVAARKDIITLFLDQDLPVFGERLARIVDTMWNKAEGASPEAFYCSLRRSLIGSGVPLKMVNKGIRENRVGDVTALRRMLGSLTLSETRVVYMGKDGSGTEFTPDSLIGKYVAESGASVKLMDVPDMNGTRDYPEKKLFVAVSAESFPLFHKYFSGRTFMSSLGHGAVLQGQLVTDVWGNTSELRAMREMTPLPMVILKTSEGERLHRYLETATQARYKNWNNALKQPWLLRNSKGEQYVHTGGYHCCTNYWGNMPIGDKLVDAYALPLVNEWGGNPNAVRQPIVEHKLVQWDNADEAALKNIWTVPGHQQVSDVLGHLERNVNGEFASPGWVIQTLMGETPSDRAPVIFIFMNDHKSEIPDKPALHYERPV
jgi:hypothetical protein